MCSRCFLDSFLWDVRSSDNTFLGVMCFFLTAKDEEQFTLYALLQLSAVLAPVEKYVLPRMSLEFCVEG